MKQTINWPFEQTQLAVENPLAEEYARWCFSNFSPMAVEVLRETLWFFFIKKDSWLHPSIAQIFAYHIEQMQERINDAVRARALKAPLIESEFKNDAKVVGAVICELLDRGLLDGAHIFKTREIMAHRHTRTSLSASGY
ncbi:hypothetical protein SAMN02745866_02536 [Alteromonadaceae bacterium Bs31]|nr:hypothetical protein SAMN02745866_02536 [Alteromonadaceae bacterium Bs31]